MIDINDAELALNYLKSTDRDAAAAKSLMNYLDDTKKTILAACYVQIETGSAADKGKQAEANTSYIEHLGKLKEATLDFELLRNKRKSAELQIEMWRSINSNQRKGNI